MHKLNIASTLGMGVAVIGGLLFSHSAMAISYSWNDIDFEVNSKVTVGAGSTRRLRKQHAAQDGASKSVTMHCSAN